MTRRYEVLSHTADTAVVAFGSTLSEVFRNAAFAMFDLMFEGEPGSTVERVRVEVQAPTIEDLLVDWLSSLLFEAESRDLAFREFGIDVLGDGRLVGWASGVAVDQLDLIGPPIKAVTYHDLSVVEALDRCEARVIFDV